LASDDRAGIRLIESGDQIEKCRFAGAGWTDQKHEFTWIYAKGDVG